MSARKRNERGELYPPLNRERCGECDGSRRVLVFENGRECAWFSWWRDVYVTRVRVRACGCTPRGVYGFKGTLRQALIAACDRYGLTVPSE